MPWPATWASMWLRRGLYALAKCAVPCPVLGGHLYTFVDSFLKVVVIEWGGQSVGSRYAMHCFCRRPRDCEEVYVLLVGSGEFRRPVLVWSYSTTLL